MTAVEEDWVVAVDILPALKGEVLACLVTSIIGDLCG